MPTNHKLAHALDALTVDMRAAAQRSGSIIELDQRERNANQCRFVATLVKTTPNGAMDPLGEAWLKAGQRMLARYAEADIDAVHAERANRRTTA